MKKTFYFNILKYCNKCKIPKYPTDFHKSSGTKDGLQPICKQCASRKWKKYYNDNKNKVILRNKKHYEWNDLDNEKLRIKYRTNINFGILCNIRRRINYAIGTNLKSGHSIELLGCSIEFLKKHLENQFKPGMSWNNYGKWHIDHIKPCASFDMSKESEQYICFNYKNLQPLWAGENISKRDKIV